MSGSVSNTPANTTLLLVEDEAITAMIGQKILENNGYSVILASDGESAVEAARTNRDINLILMDIDLGSGIDGTEAAQQILEERELPIIFLTSHSEKEMVDRVRNITRYGYVIKNSGEFVLVSSIDMAFELFNAHISLKEREKRLIMADKVAGMCFLDWDLETNRIELSDGIITLYQLDPSTHGVTPEFIASVVHPDDLERVQGALKRTIEGEEEYNIEHRVVRSDGSVIVVHNRAELIKDSNGRPVRLMGTARDITRAVQKREDLSRLNRILQAIRNVNQLLVGERNREKLIQGVCDAIISTESYSRAWIALLDDEATITDFVSAGYTDISTFPGFKGLHIDHFHCASYTLTKKGAILHEVADTQCEGCILQPVHSPNRVLSVELQYQDVISGVLTVNISENVHPDKSEFDLLYEVAGDVALGLHTIDIENERKLMIDEMKCANDRLEGMLTILQEHHETIHDFLDSALAHVITMTESTIGYIYLYDEKTHLFTLNSWSNEAMAECSVREKQTVYHLEKTGVWGDAVRLRKPIIINDFDAPDPSKKGYPEGHVHLKRFLTVPVFSEGSIVAVVGVANREKPYGINNINKLSVFMNSVWLSVKYFQTFEIIRRMEKRYSQLFDSIRDAILMADTERNITDINPAFTDIFGYTRDELIGKKTLTVYESEDEFNALGDAMKTNYKEGEPFLYTVRYRKKNGENFPGETGVFFLKDKEGETIGFIGLIRDITERIEAEEKINSLLNEKKLILREVHHRLKNNMSTIASFISLKADRIEEGPATAVLSEARDHLMSMSRLYDTLYRGPDVQSLRLDELLSGIVDQLVKTYALNPDRIEVRKELEEITISSEQALPVIQIVNELVSNSLKYAFPNNENGVLSIRAQSREDEKIEVAVNDTGPGTAENVDGSSSENFGLFLVENIAKNLKGKIDYTRGNEFTVTLTFPAKK